MTQLIADTARSFWVLADAEGNEICVCTWTDRHEREKKEMAWDCRFTWRVLLTRRWWHRVFWGDHA